MALPPDNLGRLQQRLLELSELMFNGLGLVQRNAVPVSLDDAAPDAVPVSVTQPEQWRQAAEQQQQARKAFAVSVVAASKALDELAVDALAPGETTIDASEQQFVDAQLAEQLQRAAALLKRLRACNRALMEEGLPEAKHHRGAGGSP